jgi:hypothetical protein
MVSFFGFFTGFGENEHLDERIMVPSMLPEKTFQLMFDAEFRDGFRGRAQRHLAYSASFHGMIVSR